MVTKKKFQVVVSENVNAIEHLKSQIVDRDASIEVLKAEVAGVGTNSNEELDALRGELGHKEEKLQEFHSWSSAAQSQIAEQEAEVAEKTTAITNLQTQIAELQTQIQTHNDSSNNNKQKVTDLS